MLLLSKAEALHSLQKREALLAPLPKKREALSALFPKKKRSTFSAFSKKKRSTLSASPWPPAFAVRYSSGCPSL
ncbi:hypothetical protein [Paenibacillus sp. KR2-11]|uniref:hypothetical protein n=1 Tax=Paenibacillus sp. KR2-11 TaxID=3385500 RepID=UPI0038FBFD1B